VTTLRRRVELQAGPVFVLMARLPRFVPFLVVLGLLVTGLLVQGLAGAALLGVLVVLAGLLLYLSWPALTEQARALRVLVLLLVAGRAVSFLL
jgi:hypothetical protein